MQFFLNLIKRLLPKKVLNKIRPVWHGFLAYCAAIWFVFPGNKMIVIGVTGTAGKSTTVQMLSHILNGTGHKTGFITTVSHFDGAREIMNPAGMSMPGRFKLQKYLSKMLSNGCKFAVVECTSEGLHQNRHLGINFDIALLTNLDRAHLEAHGGLENYKKAKGKLFAALGRAKQKKFFGKKMIGVNLDSREVDYFLSFPAAQKFAITFEHAVATGLLVYKCGDYADVPGGGSFTVNALPFGITLPGRFNAYNAALAIATANMLGINLEDCAGVLRQFSGVRGRMEQIANAKGLRIYLDYAPEPFAMQQSLTTLRALAGSGRLIHIFGSTGAHKGGKTGGERDISKRSEFGKISAQQADLIIITNDDIYDSDQKEIAAQIAQGIDQTPSEKRRVKEFITIYDRAQAIKKAIEIAKPGDTLVFGGKGSEQFLSLPGNKTIPWDEKQIIEGFLK